MRQGIDILAPAGSTAMMKAAVFAGANSIYLGVTGFNARRTAENFTPADLADAVAFCHARNVKVNVALNTVLYDSQLAELEQVLTAVAQSGADAIILQDLAVAALAKQIAPGLALHASTQMSVTNLAGAKLLAAHGFSRVILARELTAAEIAHITKHCGIETEAFVHGAHCMCVSGQCYMSAFFGGRSGNRGACAGPCRLPYTACGTTGPMLSLRDLSLMDYLPQLAEMGVACVKIEGRLRTPEYVAAAVDAARCALAQQPYDRTLLEKAFSRAGFTAGFYENDYLTAEMFGRRTEEDAAATKAALPALRELYRRERAAVPVTMTCTLTADRVSLTVSDGVHAVTCSTPVTTEPSKNEFTPALRRSLEKCGGTPFYAQKICCDVPAGLYCPLGAVNELRRDALTELLCKRSEPQPFEIFAPAPLPAARTRAAVPVLHARFGSAAQLSRPVAERLAAFTVPLDEAAVLAPEYRAKAILALPRAIFEEESVRAALTAAAALGYDRFEAQSVCGIGLIKETLPTAQITAGFGCNVTNTLAQTGYEALGCTVVTLSPELTLTDAAKIGGSVPRGIIGYGHLPLMLVRACPMKNVTTCAECKGKGVLRDRKGQELFVECHGQSEAGAREIYNPVPLYLGDRLREVQTDFITLYFTREDAANVRRVVGLFETGATYDGEFTRGLYYKGVSES